MLSSRALRQFIVVAEELHFGRAAARLHISQPPLSQAIMRLERELGVELLRRANRGITLTEAGRGFLGDARRLVEQEADAVARARRVDAGLSGRLTLGFVGSVSYGLLPELLARFRKELPGIAFDLRELPSTEQLQELRARRIDLGIVRLPLVDAGDFETKVIRRERMIAVLPRRHRLAGRKTIPLKLFADEAFMMFPPERVLSLHAKTMMACHAAGFSPRVALQAWQMPTMVSLVAAGVGIALLPAQIRSIPHAGVVYREVKDRSGHLELEIALAWRPELQSPLVQRVADSVRAR
jgi:DNA-binding transcriptional LysR family regulator